MITLLVPTSNSTRCLTLSVVIMPAVFRYHSCRWVKRDDALTKVDVPFIDWCRFSCRSSSTKVRLFRLAEVATFTALWGMTCLTRRLHFGAAN